MSDACPNCSDCDNSGCRELFAPAERVEGTGLQFYAAYVSEYNEVPMTAVHMWFTEPSVLELPLHAWTEGGKQ